MRTPLYIIGLLICTNLTGCAALKYGAGHKKYAEYPSRITDVPAKSFQEAIKNSRLIPIELNSTHHNAIQLNDALINIDGNTTHYKVFTIDNSQRKDIKVTINSMCSCLGFSKTIMPVQAYILDQDGSLLDKGSINFKYERYSFLPINYEGHWQGKSINSDIIYVLVAFNDASNKKRHNISGITNTGSGSIYVPMNLNVISTGEILIEATELLPAKKPPTTPTLAM